MFNDVLSIDKKFMILGEIYVITNNNNGKQYIGQTLTHRLNKRKYRPFGYKQRLLDHISEAFGNKKKESIYLNNAIRKYGADAFSVKLLLRCSINDIDENECYYIEQFKSLYPNGYNLTHGGKGARYIKHNIISTKMKIDKEPYCHTENTKHKISQQIKKTFQCPQIKQQLKSSALEQHERNRLLKFSEIVIKDDIINYIRERKNSYCIIINNLKTQFYFKTEQEKINAYQRTLSFLQTLKQQNQIAGTSLEL